MKQKVIYYSDEINDEFSGTHINPRIIDEKYNYSKNPVWDFCSYLIQNVFSMPIKVIYAKLKFDLKFEGKEKLKPYKKQGYFIYLNHTQNFLDTFLPSLAVFPKRNFLIVNPENISLKGTGWLVEMLGAIPTPNTKNATKNFLKQIEKRIKNGSSITIYPEAHIWPYYTKIRNFKAVSFKYPVKLNAPCFCITNTYQKDSKTGRVKMISYIDGPFFSQNKSSEKESCEDLRNKVYDAMTKRCKNSNVEVIEYIKKEKKQ